MSTFREDMVECNNDFNKYFDTVYSQEEVMSAITNFLAVFKIKPPKRTIFCSSFLHWNTRSRMSLEYIETKEKYNDRYKYYDDLRPSKEMVSTISYLHDRLSTKITPELLSDILDDEKDSKLGHLRNTMNVLNRFRSLDASPFYFNFNPALILFFARANDECSAQFHAWYNLLKVTHGYVLFCQTIFAYIKPTVAKFNMRGQLHSINSPAMAFADEVKIYALNGVLVPRWVVETPEEKITAEQYFNEQDVDVRREIGLKVGVSRIIEGIKGAKIIDHMDAFGIREMYRLYKCRVFGEKRVFLRMKNPSLPLNKKKHEYIESCEFVPDRVKTVRDAILFRNGLTEKQIDEKNGADYWQQGDVLIFPEDATKFKLLPAVLH